MERMTELAERERNAETESKCPEFTGNGCTVGQGDGVEVSDKAQARPEHQAGTAAWIQLLAPSLETRLAHLCLGVFKEITENSILSSSS